MQIPEKDTGGEDNDGTQNEFLTVKEACEILNVHSNTLRRWSDKGLVKTYRLNRRGDRMFKREDITDLFREKMPHFRTTK